MKSHVLIGLFLLATCQSSLAKKDSSSIVLGSTSDNNCKTLGLQCKDCETMQYCSEDKVSVFQTKCADQSKSRPYCDAETNSCVKEKPEFCEVEKQKFVCPGVGTYPNLENCYNYHICDESKEPTSFGCSIGYIYSQEVQACIPGSKCKSYSGKKGQCKDKINKLISYESSKDLYVLCLSEEHALLFQCPIEGNIFVEEEVTCRFECTQSGFFPYRPDASKFYSCMQVGKKFILNLLDCPDGTEFVELEAGQGICTIKTTTTTTTEAAPTTAAQEATTQQPQEPTTGPAEEPATEEQVEGSGEAPEESEDGIINDAQQQEVLQEVFEAVNVLSNLDGFLQDSDYNESPEENNSA